LQARPTMSPFSGRVGLIKQAAELRIGKGRGSHLLRMFQKFRKFGPEVVR
jgi:hypothetical protein